MSKTRLNKQTAADLNENGQGTLPLVRIGESYLRKENFKLFFAPDLWTYREACCRSRNPP